MFDRSRPCAPFVEVRIDYQRDVGERIDHLVALQSMTNIEAGAWVISGDEYKSTVAQVIPLLPVHYALFKVLCENTNYTAASF
ncbi:hypothetical protein AU476_10440 [Cupriavidus sp. UYMSc13B]|nr:hypothetical protein AU476_10440 [Cupriavidus sp. UYMSc13B]